VDQSITIRDAASEDAAVLAGLIRESFRNVAVRFGLTPENCPKHPSNCTTVWIESDRSRGVRYFILSQNGESIGCVGLESPSPDLCYLERLAVLPGKRLRGFGRMLAEHALACARAGGARKVSIGIIADQTELKRWYADLGFAEVQTKTFQHLPFKVSFMELGLGRAADP
jgi:GNAT superfamily N-acetyltransferase